MHRRPTAMKIEEEGEQPTRKKRRKKREEKKNLGRAPLTHVFRSLSPVDRRGTWTEPDNDRKINDQLNSIELNRNK